MRRAEEDALAAEADRYLRARRYEAGHFDGVIRHYRELQRPLRSWSSASRSLFDRVASLAALPSGAELLPVHVLDLEAHGEISRHVDHVEYSGGPRLTTARRLASESIVGLSLLSHAVMLLQHEADPAAAFDLLLPRRSLYVLRGEARYRWAHSLPLQPSFEGQSLPPKSRRISVLLRDRPPNEVPREV
ncbi:hypothetical protein EMIHUDRAFT_251025 [Emiliania huxleyi CCMP1516]|uniref:Alpha-ketoglutarate-dependent dioxygenase AlkB-like domain-containing protein n=2 Tax=Emiliania huxleyi TaxID=2903 RepID=A0A0D3KYF8_EMIH1|nr:hypothetical protein EMIHUDRAFT_251025 [Emiliania huxleyi CCMP1516]EOD40793.1 hypothetical protein EMIHUDRAFT_251025 [Emiliania huxleyi CCMP1516]|eukprot:XP_005793222.1 hypothetical protein EMIHUDRAFT_251025 [Emiliania huxleyi CCMP1516]